LAFVFAAGAAQAAWKDEPAVKALYEKAKQEGEVVVWGPACAEIEWIEAAFSKAFPGIKVPFVGDNDVFTRAIAEARGGRHQLDVMWTSINGGILLSPRNLAARRTAGARVKRRDRFDGQMLFASVRVDRHVPSRRRGADLRTRGRVSRSSSGQMIANPFLLPRLAGSLSLMGAREGLDFVRKLVVQDISC
jgi:hypothetical protein